jgi:hypothetical protein
MVRRLVDGWLGEWMADEHVLRVVGVVGDEVGSVGDEDCEASVSSECL